LLKENKYECHERYTSSIADNANVRKLEKILHCGQSAILSGMLHLLLHGIDLQPKGANLESSKPQTETNDS
jgi:hypothetical protein